MEALIVCGGTPPGQQLLKTETEKSGLVIAADQGANILLDSGLRPDIVVGDLDSFDYEAHKDINILKIAEQETNDLEKSLRYALQQGVTHCVVLGTLGKRIDHTFKNLSVMKEFHPQFESLIYRDDYGDLFLIESPFEMETTPGMIISLIQLSGKVTGITSTGVEYPLNNESLETGVRDGTSNRATGTRISIEFKEGDLALFVGNGAKLRNK